MPFSVDEYSLTESITKAFDNEAMKAGLMGVTLIFGSGDNGAVGAFSVERRGPPYCRYAPTFPAVSPYVLSVGATMARKTLSNCNIQFQSTYIRKK